jgi:hypothetical protein
MPAAAVSQLKAAVVMPQTTVILSLIFVLALVLRLEQGLKFRALLLSYSSSPCSRLSLSVLSAYAVSPCSRLSLLYITVALKFIPTA